MLPSFLDQKHVSKQEQSYRRFPKSWVLHKAIGITYLSYLNTHLFYFCTWFTWFFLLWRLQRNLLLSVSHVSLGRCVSAGLLRSEDSRIRKKNASLSIPSLPWSLIPRETSSQSFVSLWCWCRGWIGCPPHIQFLHSLHTAYQITEMMGNKKRDEKSDSVSQSLTLCSFWNRLKLEINQCWTTDILRVAWESV